jgi:ATP-binding cassette subfamily F protein uup
MLAKILANPGQILVLDEPTNDLDMDTMEMLEEIIANYDGTLFIVSHDRDFLDQTVTQILAFEGQGQVEHIVGGYSDYLAFRKKNKKVEPKEQRGHPHESVPRGHLKSNAVEEQKHQKITFKDKYALENLPKEIENLQADIEALSKDLADPDFYARDPKAFNKAAKKLERKKREKEEKEFQLLELEELIA